jgi:hypothetical protein
MESEANARQNQRVSVRTAHYLETRPSLMAALIPVPSRRSTLSLEPDEKRSETKSQGLLGTTSIAPLHEEQKTKVKTRINPTSTRTIESKYDDKPKNNTVVLIREENNKVLEISRIKNK